MSDTKDPIVGILALFRKGSALVDRAVSALDSASLALCDMDAADPAHRRKAFRSLRDAIGAAAHEGDNLLVADDAFDRAQKSPRPFVILALARQASGAFAVHPIEIDRDDLALMRGPSSEAGAIGLLPFDRLSAALDLSVDGTAIEAMGVAAAAMARQVAAARSRLTIVKSRLDLQASFLTAVIDADTGSPVVRLDSHLNHAGAREMALATRRLLGRQSLNIANTNRKTIEALFKPHVAPAA